MPLVVVVDVVGVAVRAVVAAVGVDVAVVVVVVVVLQRFVDQRRRRLSANSAGPTGFSTTTESPLPYHSHRLATRCGDKSVPAAPRRPDRPRPTKLDRLGRVESLDGPLDD